MNDSNIDLVRTGYEAFGRGDMPAVMELLQDTEWHEAEGGPQGGVYQGSEAILNGVFGPLLQQVPDFKAMPQEFLLAGDGRVLAVGTYTGRGSGGELNARFAHLWTAQGGKVTHFEQFADTALLRKAMSA